MLLKKNKKKLSKKSLGLFLGIFSLLNITFVPKASAIAFLPAAGWLLGGSALAYFGGGAVVDTIVGGFKLLLLGLLNVLIGFVQVAAAMFAYATRPEYISGPTGILNFAAVYELWKFIRDFFNLAFIFLLLFSAFSTIFQIEKFNIKKNFFRIIGAAIAINFSFPLARMVIDLGNVPMYFFAQGLMNAGGETSPNALLAVPAAFFQSSSIASISVSNPGLTTNSDFTPIITAIIFMFIFMITLFSLAILFVIRLLKLVILLIFSPMGVAASIIPGLEKYGKQWWGQLFQTVFFGPAAMLMVVIAIRFSLELNSSGFVRNLAGAAPAYNQVNADSVIYQSIFFIPIILMWMAMHVGNKFGLEGANAVMSRADKVASWGKRQALRPAGAAWRGTKATGRFAASPLTTRFRGYKAGIKDRFDNAKYGGKYWRDKSEEAEARAKARATGAFAEGGMRKELSKAEAELRDKRAREQEKKWRDEGKSVSEITEMLADPEKKEKLSKAEKLAAASFLANEKEGVKDPKVLAEALSIANETKKKDLYDKILASATDDALDMTPDNIREVREGYKNAHYEKSKQREGESDTVYAARVAEEEKKFDEALDGKFRAKFKKEGKMKVLIDYEIAENKRKGLAIPHREVYAKYMDKMKAKEIAQMKDMVDASGKLDDQFRAYVDRKKKSGEWSIKDLQDAYAELNSKQKKAWKAEGLAP